MSWFKWVKNWFKTTETKTEKQEQGVGSTISKEQTGITVAELRRKIAREFPPFTWEKVGLFLYRDFKKHNLNFTQLRGDEVLPEELVEKINSTLEIFYKRKLNI